MLRQCPKCFGSWEDDESVWGESEYQHHLLYDHSFDDDEQVEQWNFDGTLAGSVSKKVSSFLARRREKKEKEFGEYEKDYLKRQNGASDDSKGSKLQNANESILPKVKTRGRPKKAVRTAIPQNSQVRPSGFCIQCRAKLKPTAKFCGKCGTPRS